MIEQVLKELSYCIANDKIRTVLLTGGRSAKALYQRWSAVTEFDYYKQAVFFFSDERCVPPDHKYSNFRMATIAFSNMLPGTQFERIRGEAKQPVEEAMRYDALLPHMFDLVLLSVGEDGHIASLFPYGSLMKSTAKVIYISNSPKPPLERITVTPRVIQNAKHVIVMAAGKEKGRVLARAMSNPLDINEYPVRLTIGRTWVLDEEASVVFRRHAPKDHHNTKIIYV